MSAPTFETDRLVMRLPVAADYEPGKVFLATERTRYIGGVRDDWGAWRSLAAMAGHWQLRGYGFFTITLKGDDTGVGLCGPHMPGPYDEVELGWSLWRADLEGKGIAYEAALAARDWARNHLPDTRFVSYIDPDNARSIALAKRLGAVLDPDAPHPFGDEPCITYRHPEAG